MNSSIIQPLDFVVAKKYVYILLYFVFFKQYSTSATWKEAPQPSCEIAFHTWRNLIASDFTASSFPWSSHSNSVLGKESSDIKYQLTFPECGHRWR